MNIDINRLKKEDFEKINVFFEMVVRDTFVRNGIENLESDLLNEIENKKRFLGLDLTSGGINRYFLIAKDKGRIVGTIEYGPSNEVINKCSNGELQNVLEVGTVFVHPDYQNKGLGNILLNQIFAELRNKGIQKICLDSGYPNSQRIWVHKFGSPSYHLRDYWGKGLDHMVWVKKL